MKKIRLSCLLLALLMLFCACNGGGTQTPETNPQTSEVTGPTTGNQTPPVAENPAFSAFQIVRSDKASQTVIGGMTDLNKVIREITGKTLSPKTDFKAADEITYEILIGNTTRDASKTIASLLKNGDYVIQTVITDTAVKVVILGSDDDMTVRAAEVFGEMIKNGEVIDENGNIKTLNFSKNFYKEYENFRLDISEPIVVYQAAEADDHWGHYQFPQIYYTTTGAIRVSYSYSNDSIYDNGAAYTGWLYSEDDGATWAEVTDENGAEAGTPVQNPNKALMSNGNYFAGFRSYKSYGDVDYISKYSDKKVATATSASLPVVDMYYAEDVTDYTFAIFGREYNPTTKSFTEFPVTFNWPYMPVCYGRSPQTTQMTYLMPTETYIAISNYMGLISTDDGLYYCTYARGFDSQTGKATRYSNLYSVYVFHSADNGRTWNYKSQITMSTKVAREISEVSNWNNCEGFCEPSMTVTPDGTFVMLLRTGSDHPSYIVQSTDGCETWSEPEMFDECGVLPQMLTLDCGVTIASYGRPDLYIRATSDMAGEEWQERIQIALNDEGITNWGQSSCFYTFLLQTSATSAIMVYTDFNYPNENNEPRRTVLIRKIDIVPTDTSR